ncbi:Hpt domain-containing protein [Vogesella sp. DC21W]|uniref:Hpt domain-containing protein n=1 Tax=Vogesella aquatica TaxID=2984206 RepID=A0ABT5IW48_9NEIS|nr:HD domain-containing phosphohydrolase [Vogesella aquatica]MDC7716791.1 Hpt domain-containing protein [Vogesella aquatica]
MDRYRIEDEESFSDFQYALDDYAPRIANLLAALRQSPQDAGMLAELMRLFHTIKGDAGLCRLGFVEPMVHAAEDLLSRVRSGGLPFDGALEQLLLLAMDRLELVISELDSGREVPLTDFNRLVAEMSQLNDTAPALVEAQAWLVIKRLTGFLPQQPLPVAVPRSPQVDADLQYFRTLALQFEQRSLLFQGRTERNLLLAAACNEASVQPIDPLQLEAAVCMHDVGMMFLPEELWLKHGKLSDADRLQLAAHPGWGADMLARMRGWEEAARIVREHHERIDGTGYPAGKRADMICEGAKLLAIIDTFEAVILKHGQRRQVRSLLRAVAEVNACESQFDPAWIACFNLVVRDMIERGFVLPHVR